MCFCLHTSRPEAVENLVIISYSYLNYVLLVFLVVEHHNSPFCRLFNRMSARGESLYSLGWTICSRRQGLSTIMCSALNKARLF